MKIAFKIPPQAKKYTRMLAPVARHHYFIAMLVLFGGVALATYGINETMNKQPDSAYRAEQMQSTIGNKFNKTAEETIEELKSLHKSSDPSSSNAPFPPGRINPFAE